MNTFNRIQSILFILIFCTYCNTSSLNKNIAAANDVKSLQKNITSIFAEKYKEKSKTLGQELIDYFRCHKLNKWQDIKDDINNGYDNCFCKGAMFKHLNIKNINQKHSEYLNLKKALNGDEHLSDNNIADAKQDAAEHKTQQNEIWQLNDMKTIVNKLSIAQFQLHSLVPKLTSLKTRLQNSQINNNQQKLEKEYRELSKKYEQGYKQYLSCLFQIQQLNVIKTIAPNSTSLQYKVLNTQGNNNQKELEFLAIKLSITQSQLHNLVPKLTSLQTRLQNSQGNNNQQKLEKEYRELSIKYEQGYKQYISYLLQIQQFKQNIE